MKPMLTIVVPVRNRATLLPRCLESIRAQSLRPLRLIVVDNGSTDNSAAIAQEWAQKNGSDDFQVTVLQEPTPGACNARNRGLEAVTTPFVSFFDSDDAMRPELAAEAVNAIKQAPETDIVTWRCSLHTLDDKEAPLKWAKSNFLTNHILHAVLRTHAYAVRTDFIRNAGMWNPLLPVWNDWELGIRLLTKNPKIALVDKILADIHATSRSITGTSFHAKRGEWELALEAAKPLLANSPKHLRWLAYRAAILAAHYRREGFEEDANTLLRKALQQYKLSPAQKMALKFAYALTNRGIRGAYIFCSPFLNNNTPF